MLEPVYAGRRVVLACGPVQSKTAMVAQLRSMGVADCLVVGSSGTGPHPEADCVLVDVAAGDPVEEFRRWEALAARPPPDVTRAVDRFAPDMVLTTGIEALTTFAGRPVFGGRRPEWTAYEDKLTVDTLWDDAGVARAPAEIVPVDGPHGWAAHERLDRGDGTVWSGDMCDGWHGGGELVRRVRSRPEADRARRRLAAHCDRMRVVPFLEGLPCSIHGFVTGDGVAAFRPVEMLVLRTPDGFRYCAAATTWDPAPDDREDMRRAVRRVGTLLHDRARFRGFFTIDGVMTVDGFRPTELNPRIGAGLRYVGVCLPDLPLALLQFAVVEEQVSVDIDAMEQAIVGAADRFRLRACHTFVHGRRQSEDQTHVDGDTSMVLGPGAMGAFLRVTTTGTPPDGQPFAPTAVRALELADRHWSLGLGPLSAAPDVRSRYGRPHARREEPT